MVKISNPKERDAMDVVTGRLVKVNMALFRDLVSLILPDARNAAREAAL